MNAHAPGVCDDDSTPLTPYEKYSPSQMAETVFLDLFHGFDRILQEGVHLPFRGVQPGPRGVHLQKGGSKGTIAKLKGARIIIP